MRIRSVLIGSAAVAAVIAGVSSAQAASAQAKPVGQTPFDIADTFAPTQIDMSGAVYGVRTRTDSQASAINSLLIKPIVTPTASLPPATGKLTVLSQPNSPRGTLTPDPCNSAGNFPGGWCNTAHSIAANTFGWNFSSGGAGAIIGMVDTGIDLNQVEFAGRVLPGHCVTSAVNPCTSADDMLGGDDAVFPGPNATHGTHTTGIAAGANVGIAFQASILPVKVCSSTANSCGGVADGILWAAQHGAQIVSVSIGGPILGASEVTELQQAVSAGALIVVAAGNGGTKDPTGGAYAGAALDDGIRGSMIVVGATGCNGPNPNVPTNCANGGLGGIASFSQSPGNRCEVHGGARFCMKDFFVVAPGVNIWSSVGNGPTTSSNYGYLSGTSMATPFVSGVAAVIKGASPFLTSAQVADIIFNSTDDMGAPGVDPVYGRGAVDITKAMSPAGATIVANHSLSIGVTGTVGSANVAAVNSTTNPSAVAGMMGDAAANAKLASLGKASSAPTIATGILGTAIQNSTILKNAIVIDSYGRAFTENLTKASYNPGFDFTGYLMSSNFTSFAPFAYGGEGPLGKFVASGYAVDDVLPHLLAGEFMTSDRNRYDVRDFQFTTSVSDRVDLTMGYNLDLQGRFNGYDLQGSSAYDGLFVSGSAMNSPYESFTNGGNYIGANVKLADDLHVHFGQSSLGVMRGEYEVPVFSYLTQLQGTSGQYDQRTAQTTMAGMDWDFASWGGLGLTASNTTEQHGMLGGIESGSLSLTNGANTSAVGLSGRVGFGAGWVTTVSYSEGITQLDLQASSLISNADTLHSRAYGVAVAKHGLFADNDSLGMAVSRPVQVYDGSVNLTAATGVDDTGNLLTSSEHLSLASKTPETDFELGYVTTFFDGALALQANAAWQQNLAGANGVNSLAVLSRAKVNF